MNNTTVDALKDVYTELGGSAATVASMQTDAEVIEALSTLVGSTIELPAVTAEDNGDVLTVVEGAWAKAEPVTPTSELPTVTSEDNGDVLTVVEGAWAKATPSGAKTVLWSGCTEASNTLNLPSGKTIGDLLNEINNGNNVILKNQNNYYYYLRSMNGTTYFYFDRMIPESNTGLNNGIDMLDYAIVLFTKAQTTGTSGAVKKFAIAPKT